MQHNSSSGLFVWRQLCAVLEADMQPFPEFLRTSAGVPERQVPYFERWVSMYDRHLSSLPPSQVGHDATLSRLLTNRSAKGGGSPLLPLAVSLPGSAALLVS